MAGSTRFEGGTSLAFLSPAGWLDCERAWHCVEALQCVELAAWSGRGLSQRHMARWQQAVGAAVFGARGEELVRSCVVQARFGAVFAAVAVSADGAAAQAAQQ